MRAKIVGGFVAYIILCVSGALTMQVRYQDPFLHALPGIALCGVLPVLFLVLGIGISSDAHRRGTRCLQVCYGFVVITESILYLFPRYPDGEMATATVFMLIGAVLIGAAEEPSTTRLQTPHPDPHPDLHPDQRPAA